MSKKGNLQGIYSQYNHQIDAIMSFHGMKYRRAARIISWFYGGTEAGWRVFLATKVKPKKVPKEVADLLARFTK